LPELKAGKRHALLSEAIHFAPRYEFAVLGPSISIQPDAIQPPHTNRQEQHGLPIAKLPTDSGSLSYHTFAIRRASQKAAPDVIESQRLNKIPCAGQYANAEQM
jgi:hypothetical protein